MKRVLLPWGTDRGLGLELEGALITGRGCLTYSELKETTGTAGASVTFWDGASDNGQVLLEYTLSAGQSTSEQWGHHWLPFEEGLYFSVLTGSAVGSLTLWVDHSCEWWLAAPHLAAEVEAADALAALRARLGG